MTLIDLEKLASSLPNSEKMPVMFIGHGNPMNALLENEFVSGWRKAAENIRPSYILCISAHWESRGTFVTGNTNPKTIHDFGGFPQALFDYQYPAAGSPELANMIQSNITSTSIQITDEWGLDHGTWSILAQMFPNADVPVLQMSLDRNLSTQQMYDLATELQFLRTKGVLIIGSGNIVHNLRMAKFGSADTSPYDWASEFDAKVAELILSRSHEKLIDYKQLGEAAKLSVPTPEHYLPLLYTLALQEKSEEVVFFNEGIDFGSGGMRSLIVS